MTRQQAQQLEDIKTEVASAAQELQAGETGGCCGRLVDALLLVTQFMEEL